MTNSKANAQTRATEKYHQKIGLVAKTYKLKKELVDEFKRTCDKIGISQAAAISSLMRQFIDDNK